MSPSQKSGVPDPRGNKLYDFEETTVYAYAGDTRFSYCLYVPPDLPGAAGAGHGGASQAVAGPQHPLGGRGAPPELLVMVHGTGRAFTRYRDALSEFGRWNRCIVLCPLFPVGVMGDGNRDGFKHLREGDIRYDLVLLGMVDEVAARYGVRLDSFALSGYSGGGQFTNRFMYLHPGRLWAASIGAPGSVTLLDPGRDWWVGTAGIHEVFGVHLDLEALRRLPVQLVAGAADLETWEITHREGGRHWMPGANDAGRTRPERLAALQRSLRAAGVDAQLDILPGVAHDGMRCLGAAKRFFASVLSRRRAGLPAADAPLNHFSET